MFSHIRRASSSSSICCQYCCQPLHRVRMSSFIKQCCLTTALIYARNMHMIILFTPIFFPQKQHFIFLEPIILCLASTSPVLTSKQALLMYCSLIITKVSISMQRHTSQHIKSSSSLSHLPLALYYLQLCFVGHTVYHVRWC